MKAKDLSLSDVITALRDTYEIKVSFNDNKLSAYKVNIDKTFPNADKALKYLIKDLPLKLEVVSNVFIVSELEKNYLISGNIRDVNSNETLPFSTVVINGLSLLAGPRGNFSFSSNTDSVFKLQVSYLGYLKLDTILAADNYISLKLQQNQITLSEVVFSSWQPTIESNSFYSAGSLKINQNVGQNLPGDSDNSVYNLLRLQPGILASGDQFNDLMIWGSYKGQTKVSFDGFTIFGLKNFNDEIGAINPLVAKDLNILKGGYGVSQGDRVGGVVDITGIEGNTAKPTLKIGVDNLTVNGVATMPLFKNTALVIAARQTYYNLFNPYQLTNNGKRNVLGNSADFNVVPDYSFNDFNIKFAGKSEKGENFYFSLFKGNDNISSAYNTTQGRFKVDGENSEQNKQFGGATNYTKVWNKGSISSITLASSGLNKKNSNATQLDYANNDQLYSKTAEQLKNNISETSIKLTHLLPTKENYSVLVGLGYIYNQTLLHQDSVNINIVNQSASSNRFYTFSEVNYFVNPKLKLTPGIRINYDINLGKPFFQPRFALNYQVNEEFKVSGAWGIYKQFIAYNATVDEPGNLNYNWTVCDGTNTPIFSANHFVIGAVLRNNSWKLDVNLYSKTISGITKVMQTKNGSTTVVGNGKSIGMDVLVRKNYKGSIAWIAYTLSETTESYPTKTKGSFANSYERAPQDQTHEVKVACILNMSPVFFSANYVYGSGFPNTNPNKNVTDETLQYQRFDTAVTYKFSAKKYALETGLSILNLFDTQNLKLENLRRIPTEQTNTLNIYNQTVPFTPTVFLNFSI